MDTDSFILSVNTKDIFKDLQISEYIFDFGNLDENHEQFSNKNHKVFGKFKIEISENIWIDKFVCLRSKIHLFKCGDDSKNKLKRVSKSQSQHFELEEYYNCLIGGEYQKECEKYIIRSPNHEMYLQEVKKSTLSIVDVKRCYINETESKPWN